MNGSVWSSRVSSQDDRQAPGTAGQAAQSPNGVAPRFAISESSLIDVLHKVAAQYANRAAYKFVDYETDPNRFTEKHANPRRWT
jgi:hypothetical protein